MERRRDGGPRRAVRAPSRHRPRAHAADEPAVVAGGRRLRRRVRAAGAQLGVAEAGAAAAGAHAARGSARPKLFAHIAEYGDGWIPIGGAGVAQALPELRRAVEAAGRDPSTLHVVPFGTRPNPASSSTTAKSASPKWCSTSPRLAATTCSTRWTTTRIPLATLRACRHYRAGRRPRRLLASVSQEASAQVQMGRRRFHRLDDEARRQIIRLAARASPIAGSSGRVSRGRGQRLRAARLVYRPGLWQPSAFRLSTKSGSRSARVERAGPSHATSWVGYRPSAGRSTPAEVGDRRAPAACNWLDGRASCPPAGVVADLEKLWSPWQIARRLREEFGDEPEMQVSHETIYKTLYVQGRGELRRELARCLRSGRAHATRAGPRGPPTSRT